MVKLPPHRHAFPKMAGNAPRANSWGSQWTHLPRVLGRLMRVKSSLRVMPIEEPPAGK